MIDKFFDFIFWCVTGSRLDGSTEAIYTEKQVGSALLLGNFCLFLVMLATSNVDSALVLVFVVAFLVACDSVLTRITAKLTS